MFKSKEAWRTVRHRGTTAPCRAASTLRTVVPGGGARVWGGVPGAVPGVTTVVWVRVSEGLILRQKSTVLDKKTTVLDKKSTVFHEIS